MTHEKFALARSQAQFARLLSLSQEQQRTLAENPKPFLDMACKELLVARKLVRDIADIANGVSYQMSSSDQVESFGGNLANRLQKIKDLLKEAGN